MKLNHSYLLPLTLLLILAAGPVATAQDEGDAEGVESVTGQSMIIAASDDEGGMAEIQVFSTGDGGMGNTFFMGDGMMPAPNVFALANNKSVQKEIELVDGQLQQLRNINKEFSDKISEHVRDIGSGNMNPDRGRELSEMIKRLNDEKQSKMEGVLLPHQFDRLRQIALQTRMQRSGDADTLASRQVVEALGISEEQQKKIESRAAEIKQELQKDIARLKERARDELLGELTRDQRAKLDEMMGEKFKVETPDFRDRINRFRKAREQRDDDDDKPNE